MAVALEAEGAKPGTWSITYLRDEPILALNRQWLAHDWIPDVLSFALQEAGEAPIGDLYVGVDQARRQAEELGVPVAEELVRLTVHGVLHVLGYEHPEDPPAREGSAFFRKQEALVRRVVGGGEAGGADSVARVGAR